MLPERARKPLMTANAVPHVPLNGLCLRLSGMERFTAPANCEFKSNIADEILEIWWILGRDIYYKNIKCIQSDGQEGLKDLIYDIGIFMKRIYKRWRKKQQQKGAGE